MVKMVSMRVIALGVYSSVRVLGVGVSMVVTTFVAIYLCLSRGASVRHGNIIGARASIP